MVSNIAEVFEKLNGHQGRIVFDGADIISQIPAHIRKEAFLDRPSDVRLLVITDNRGQRSDIVNHGHPENEVSLVDFNGENGIMIMPAGNSSYEQIKNAQKIVEALNGRKITPEFIRDNISPPSSPLHGAVKEIYGPVTGRDGVNAQVSRFVESPVIAPDGHILNVAPDVANNYAMGMRAPTREEVYKIELQTVLPAALMGDEFKENIAARQIYLKGEGTANEKLDPFIAVQDVIYLTVDAANGVAKPLKKTVAEAIFDVKKAVALSVDEDGGLTSVTIPLSPRESRPTPHMAPQF